MCDSFQTASVSTLSMHSFSPDWCCGVASSVRAEAAQEQGFWGPTYSSAPPSLCHAHTDTPMRTQSHVHFLALFQQAENKEAGTSGLICRDRIPELISHQHLIHLPVLSSRRNDSLCASNKSNKKKKIKREYSRTMLFFLFFVFFFS